MDFLPDDDQVALVRSSADVLAKELPSRRDMVASGWSSRAFLRRCAGLGWFGLGVPEADGGVGATLVEEALLFREIGRAVVPGPLLPTVLGARVALAAGDTTTATAILGGDVVVGFAERAPATAEDAAERWRVFDASEAELVVVLGPGEARLVRTPELRPQPCMDELTSMAGADVAAADEVAVAPSPEPILHVGYVLVAAMLTGIAEATRDMSVAYLKDRQQFGRPIGSFQALKHQAADMAVEAEMALSLTTYAALGLVEGDRHAPLSCLAARVLTHRAALANARANVQHHGAMGTTFEHDAHFYVKRTHVLAHLMGGVRAPLLSIFEQPSPLET